MVQQTAQQILSLPTWAKLWLILGNLIVFWDATFVLMRPHSMAGGLYEYIWIPYQKYILHDKRYADMDEPFVVAQSVINLIELLLGLYAVYLHSNIKTRPLSLVVALIASVMTWSKTTLYFAIEYYGKMNYTGHNIASDFIFFFFIPSFVWVLVPMLVTRMTARKLIAAASLAQNTKTK
ncbi:hypothetical protein AKO1_011298 [Acrasis kona]|uniref:Emopamil-binding protein n=1 Tax=Acrasis kona TaxID=1008807 RepID=A0AAW2YXN1_9EUKA